MYTTDDLRNVHKYLGLFIYLFNYLFIVFCRPKYLVFQGIHFMHSMIIEPIVFKLHEHLQILYRAVFVQCAYVEHFQSVSYKGLKCFFILKQLLSSNSVFFLSTETD